MPIYSMTGILYHEVSFLFPNLACVHSLSVPLCPSSFTFLHTWWLRNVFFPTLIPSNIWDIPVQIPEGHTHIPLPRMFRGMCKVHTATLVFWLTNKSKKPGGGKGEENIAEGTVNVVCWDLIQHGRWRWSYLIRFSKKKPCKRTNF